MLTEIRCPCRRVNPPYQGAKCNRYLGKVDGAYVFKCDRCKGVIEGDTNKGWMKILVQPEK